MPTPLTAEEKKRLLDDLIFEPKGYERGCSMVIRFQRGWGVEAFTSKRASFQVPDLTDGVLMVRTALGQTIILTPQEARFLREFLVSHEMQMMEGS